MSDHPLVFLAVLAALLAAATPSIAQTIIIDDADGAPGFTLTGNDWTTWGMIGYGFDGGDTDYHYLSHTVGGNDRRGTATWTPDIPTAGTWQIETWFRRTENRTDDADHYVYDGLGGSTHTSLDQRGSGASGWIDLGQHWCAAGWGGCSVVLDGTDDDQSDEANAVRFTLVAAENPPEPELPPDCEAFPGLGAHAQEVQATQVSGADWTDTSAAVGAPDGVEAQTPNADAGEYLQVDGWGDLCDPPGEETIDAVYVEVFARTQYQSGQYALDLLLTGGGAASTVFTGTSAAWRSVDVTSDLAAWTWADPAGVVGHLSLWDHPGGERDSDAWVDAWRLRVEYTTTAAPGDDDDDVAPEDDDDVQPEDDDDALPEDDDDAGADDDDAGVDDDDTEPDQPDDDDVVPQDDDDSAPLMDDDAGQEQDDLALDDPEGLPTDAVSGCACDQDVGGEPLALLPLVGLPLLGWRRRGR